MGQYLVRFVLMVAILDRAWSYPLDTTKEVENVNRNNSMCNYKGSRHNDGDVINVDEPCLSCRCKKGALTCSLRICPDVPEPPPPGCYIVHNTNQCCPQILCQTDKKESDIEVRTISGPSSDMEVCVVNGSLYAEGSALESSDTCEYCYCIKGQQKCIKPKCAMPFEGCQPIYSQKSCCPTQYDCRGQMNVSRIQEKNLGCQIGGIRYAEGDMLYVNSTLCENCYCMRGEVRCVPVTCETEFHGGCEPVYKPGQCCPISYVCSKTITETSENSVRTLSQRLDRKDQENEGSHQETNGSEERTTTGGPDTSQNTAETLATTSVQDEAESTTELDDSLKSRIDDLGNVTDTSSQKNDIPETTDQDTTTETEESTPPFVTFYPNVVRNEVFDIASRNQEKYLKENNTAEESTTSLPALEDIYGSSPHADDEYDSYDYNEPKLPPSLPNLIIFPFVAADAVVKDEEVPKTATYDETSIKRVGTEPAFYKDYFSPPAKTEGGFVPKRPPSLADVYHENGYLGNDGSVSSVERPGGLIPSITVPPKTNMDQCLLKGHVFEHGALLSEPGDCQSCICYYGDVICQQVICPEVGKGCVRTQEKDAKSCCGKVVCDIKETEEPPVQLEFVHSLEKFPATKKSKPTKPPVPDVIEVTPSPYREVIRTETAPDVMDELIPFYAEQQTKKPVTVTYKNLIVDYYPDFLVTTSRDDLRKKNYKNPVFYTTEMYPFTEKPDESGNVTFPNQQTVTSSISTSEGDLEGDHSKYPFGKIELVRTSIRPIITMATEPSRLFEYYTVEEYRPAAKQQSTRRTRPPVLNGARPTKKTTEVSAHAKDGHNSTPPAKASSSKHKYPSKTKTKLSTTTEKNSVDDSFSLDSVLRFFFNTETSTTQAPPTKYVSTTRKTTKKDSVNNVVEERSKQTTGSPASDFRHKHAQSSTEDSRSTDKKNAIGSLLKLAGCNIYGRMYRVGKIIAELSNPCLECICTDFGVECNPLLC